MDEATKAAVDALVGQHMRQAVEDFRAELRQAGEWLAEKFRTELTAELCGLLREGLAPEAAPEAPPEAAAE